MSYTEVIHTTENQDMETISIESVVPHTRREPTASTSASTSTTTSTTTSTSARHELFSDDASDDESELTNESDLVNRIKREIDRYKSVKMKKEQKSNLKLISWWQERRAEYPYLFKAVKSMLCTPGTSVPSERIFSEAGYISHAKRSKILPVNLDKYLFIKRNKLYLPDTTQDYFAPEEV